MSNKKSISICSKCKNPLVLKKVEHILAPETPTIVLKTYGCDVCNPPKEEKGEPMCSSCHRNITDSPAGGCTTPKEHG